MSKNYFEQKYQDFREWFLDKEHPHSKLNRNVFVHDVLKFVGFLLIFLIIYNNIDKLNQINIWIIKLGSILLLVSLFFVLRKAWHLGVNLKYWFRGFNHGTKLLIGLFIVLLLLMAYFNQEKVISGVTNSYDKIKFNSFNPVKLEALNISLGGLTKNLNTCAQINAPINFYGYQSFDGTVGTISGTYEGWSIHGQATCRKGSKEGENLNKYYCGGYTYIFGIGSVNAYIQKTTISGNGEIGKTYKYVIWNIYDENKNFLETKCLGNPDDFDQKQAQALYNEMLKWA